MSLQADPSSSTSSLPLDTSYVITGWDSLKNKLCYFGELILLSAMHCNGGLQTRYIETNKKLYYLRLDGRKIKCLLT